MSRVDAWYMVRRRTADVGIDAAIGNHSFRAIGITDYMENGGNITIAQCMAGHANIKTTQVMTGALIRSVSARLSGWGFESELTVRI